MCGSLTATSVVSPCSKYSLNMATACFLNSSMLRCGEDGDTVYVPCARENKEYIMAGRKEE